eukprot:GILJ01013427.1.p1 GENE.GILJ01013427.1~~GILJ01013427.1.p1  ORF type:complete len:1131 (-),score=137.22 GILJ01013427.1:163-3555(-)
MSVQQMPIATELTDGTGFTNSVPQSDFLNYRLREKPTLAKPLEWVMQDKCCNSAHYSLLEKCCTCVLSQNENVEGCRFVNFREIARSVTSQGVIFTTQFGSKSESEIKAFDEKQCELPQRELTAPFAMVLLNRLSAEFRKLRKKELDITQPETATLRETEKGFRHLCDNCETTIFNLHWFCRICGTDICLDCHMRCLARCNETSGIITCTYNREHSAEHFLLARKLDLAMFKSIVERERCAVKATPSACTCSAFELNSSHGNNNAYSNDPLLHECNQWSCSQPLYTRYPSIFTKPLVCLERERMLDGQRHFTAAWSRGEPVVVSNVHQLLKKAWTGGELMGALQEEAFDVVDCETNETVQNISLKQFFDGFEGLDYQVNGSSTHSYKLKDWPPHEQFRDKLPEHYEDFTSALPFQDYTNPSGICNIAAYLPSHLCPPDLGPKMYIAYGQPTFSGNTPRRQPATTSLHVDIADAVNVLVYIGGAEHKKEDEMANESEKSVASCVKQEDDALTDSSSDLTLSTKQKSCYKEPSPDAAVDTAAAVRDTNVDELQKSSDNSEHCENTTNRCVVPQTVSGATTSTQSNVSVDGASNLLELSQSVDKQAQEGSDDAMIKSPCSTKDASPSSPVVTAPMSVDALVESPVDSGAVTESMTGDSEYADDFCIPNSAGRAAVNASTTTTSSSSNKANSTIHSTVVYLEKTKIKFVFAEENNAASEEVVITLPETSGTVCDPSHNPGTAVQSIEMDVQTSKSTTVEIETPKKKRIVSRWRKPPPSAAAAKKVRVSPEPADAPIPVSVHAHSCKDSPSRVQLPIRESRKRKMNVLHSDYIPSTLITRVNMKNLNRNENERKSKKPFEPVTKDVVYQDVKKPKQQNDRKSISRAKKPRYGPTMPHDEVWGDFSPEEAEAFKVGLERYGENQWHEYLKDSTIGPTLKRRTEQDLKAVWRRLVRDIQSAEWELLDIEEAADPSIGAVWDIYSFEDTETIKAFLKDVAARRRWTLLGDPIHDQCFYLNNELRQELREQWGVVGWRFYQKLGDAVFIPAGCPHQVRNVRSCVKVAKDFVSPENIHRCVQITNEFRHLPTGHKNKQDKLQIGTMLYCAVKKLLEVVLPASTLDNNDESEHVADINLLV